jgi:hypothetical protein
MLGQWCALSFTVVEKALGSFVKRPFHYRKSGVPQALSGEAYDKPMVDNAIFVPEQWNENDLF